jgi:hypothetical protein
MPAAAAGASAAASTGAASSGAVAASAATHQQHSSAPSCTSCSCAPACTPLLLPPPTQIHTTRPRTERRLHIRRQPISHRPCLAVATGGITAVSVASPAVHASAALLRPLLHRLQLHPRVHPAAAAACRHTTRTKPWLHIRRQRVSHRPRFSTLSTVITHVISAVLRPAQLPKC